MLRVHWASLHSYRELDLIDLLASLSSKAAASEWPVAALGVAVELLSDETNQFGRN